jgi:hypothetical protein
VCRSRRSPHIRLAADTEDRLRETFDQGLLTERHTVEFKAKLDQGTGANKEHAHAAGAGWCWSPAEGDAKHDDTAARSRLGQRLSRASRRGRLVKVFVSSLSGGYEHYRAAVQEAIEILGHQVVRAEDFPASADTPQRACLTAVRESDVVVLLIGERYGAVQPSGLSATHEEYREAKERKPVLVFVESGVTREPAQQAFLEEVQTWATGHIRPAYASAEELKTAVLRALHDHELASSAGPVDQADLVARATALLPSRQGFDGHERLAVAVAGGPAQQVLRPAELGEPALARDVQREALFGEHPVLDTGEGTTAATHGNALVLGQRMASVLVDQAGSVCVIQAARRETNSLHTELPALIEEDVAGALARAVRFSGWLLDRVDPLHRLTDVAVVARLAGGGYLPWRTRAEHAASPTAATKGQGGDETTVTLTPLRRHRQALTHDAARIAEDLVTLRLKWSGAMPAPIPNPFRRVLRHGGSHGPTPAATARRRSPRSTRSGPGRRPRPGCVQRPSP